MVRSARRLRLRGGGSKTALSRQRGDADMLTLSQLNGVLNYQPQEFTFTALAGTSVLDVSQLLAAHGQYLPFDPPLMARGATLGGTLAAGLSGAGRYRYGGARDFVLGVRFINGHGEIIRGGSNVVKNAAGFDLPKLMVGSLGRIGALVEATLKVFPLPIACRTVVRTFQTLPVALQAMAQLAVSKVELQALDVLPGDDGAATVLARLGGLPAALSARCERLRQALGGGDVFTDKDDEKFWREAREFHWLMTGESLVKVPVTPSQIAPLDDWLGQEGCARRYSVGGNLAWLAWRGDIEPLHNALRRLALRGLVVMGDVRSPLIGAEGATGMERRVKAALDPDGKFI